MAKAVIEQIKSGAESGMVAWRNRPIRYLILAAALLIGAIAIGAAVMIENFRDRAITEAERELKNTSLILSGQIDRAFQSIELVQTGVAAKAQAIATSKDFAREMSGQDTHLMLKNSIGGLAQVDAITLIDSDGKLLNYSRGWPVPDVSVADRDYFKALKSGSNPTSFITLPLANRVNGSETIFFAHKLTASNGEFLGLVIAAIDLSYFEKLFRSIQLGSSSSVGLYRSDGVLLARYPRIEAAIGKQYKAALGALGKNNAGTARFIGQMRGGDRMLAAHRLSSFPLFVVVAVDTDKALAEWRNETRLLLGISGLAALIIISMIVLIARHLFREQNLSQQRLELERKRLDTALNNMPQGLLMFDSSERMVVCNRRFIEMYGLSPEVVKPGCTLREIISHRKTTGSFLGDIDQYHSEISTKLAQGASETIFNTADGRVIRVKSQPVAGGGWVTTHVDITDRIRIENERDRSQAFLNQIISNVPTAIIVKDVLSLRYVLINKAAEQYFGISSEQIIGKTAHELWPQATADLIAEQDEKLLRSDGYLSFDEHRFESPGKGVRFITSRRIIVRHADGRPQYVLGVMEDVTDRKLASERMVHLAHYDPLTDLPNRVFFREQLERAFEWVHRNEQIAVLFLDLDHFQTINDSLGPRIGDDLLKAVAGRLRACLRETEFVSRLGGDEFAIIQTAITVPADITNLVARIDTVFKDPFMVDGHELRAATSIGIAVAPDDGADSDHLLKNADLAMYGAKADGRGTYRFFEADMDARVKSRRALETDLREAILHCQFELNYQPIVNLQNNKISGCEALLRWRHPVRGMISPADFIPIAEETGLIIPIGEWVLSTACAQAAAWPDNIKVAINVSPVQFKSGGLMQLIVNTLAMSGLSAQRLELEITEAALIHDDAVALAILHQLRELGVRIAMDDFGTGYSSLSYLQRFPFDKIKIDQSFIKGVEESVSQQSIVQAVITLAKTRNMTTTAEGVEMKQQRKILRALGCTEMQGYLYSPAIPPVEMTKLILADATIGTLVA